MKKQQDKNNPPEEWELTLTLEPEEEELSEEMLQINRNPATAAP